MKALREGALWLAVFGSVAGFSWSLHEWEAADRQATACVSGVATQEMRPQCDGAPALGEPAVLRAGQVGLD